jgi:molecular chaperone GrpE
MSDEDIDAILGEFRAWLREHGDAAGAAPPDLVGEFTALRHEVKLLTRAARAQNEQLAEALGRLTAPAGEGDDPVRPLLMAAVELMDALGRSTEAVINLADYGPAPVSPWRRWLGAARHAEATRRRLDGVAEGLRLSGKRVEDVLRRMGLEAVPTLAQPFDPETMEALEVVTDSSCPAGSVVDEVRRGYTWRGKVLRAAQVRVAK